MQKDKQERVVEKKTHENHEKYNDKKTNKNVLMKKNTTKTHKKYILTRGACNQNVLLKEIP